MMPEHKQKRRNSLPAQRTRSARDMVPESSGVLAQLPNSARLSVAEPESGNLDALAEKFAQHKLPSEELNDGIILDAVPQLDEDGAGQLRNELGEDQARPVSRMKKANFFSRMGAGIWDSAVGSRVRRHRRAYEDIMEHKRDKSYYKIGGMNRFLYFMNNPLAVMRSWGSKDKWNETHDTRMQEERDRIARYQAENNVQALDHDSYHWGTDPVRSENVQPGGQVPGQEKKEEKIVGNAKYGPSFSVTDTLLKDIPTADTLLKLKQVQGLPAAKWFTREDRQFLPEDMMETASINDMAVMTGSTLKTLKGIKGVAKSISDAKKSMATGLAGKKTNAVLTVLSSIFSTARMAGMAAGKIGSKFKKLMPERVANVLTWSGKPFAKLFGRDFNPLNALGVAASGTNLLKGGVDMLSGARTKGKLSDVKDSLKKEKLAEGEKTSLGKLTRQAGSAANQRLINGLSGILNGTAGAAGSISLTAPLTAVAKVGGIGIEKMTGLFSGIHQSSMDRKVLKEDMPDLDDKIEAYARKLAEDKGLDPENVGAMEQKRLRRQAKHIVLKAHGFRSGKRSEAAAFFNTARAKYLASRANRQQEGNSGDSIAQALVDAIGVDRRSDGFNENDIAERLGRAKQQEGVIASRSSNIEALAQKKNRGFWNNTKRLFGWMFS